MRRMIRIDPVLSLRRLSGQLLLGKRVFSSKKWVLVGLMLPGSMACCGGSVSSLPVVNGCFWFCVGCYSDRYE